MWTSTGRVGAALLLTLILTPTVPAGAPAAVPAGSEPVATGGRTDVRAAGPFRWPLAGRALVVRRFEPPPQPWLAGHRGVDLAGDPGAEVRAAGPGTVLFAGPVAGRPVVTVGHRDGLRTTYEPVRSRLDAGAPVDAGTPIGELRGGHPGCPVTACLHWGLRRGADYLDPLALLGFGRARLLPLDPTPPGP
ncbi:murein hydrolase activator EnvC family protein [Micromonospora sediminicola]|uniref:murein hydrolase activator EnvC family protein n=1 Tax=Micromonospora sediminicola TaxID=946078 RepID=UPI0033EA8F79